MQLGKAEFENLLREKGLKVTTQRLAVLSALSQKADSHLTAEEIYELVKVSNPDIGLATVYRTIQLLLELKIIDRIHLDDGYVRYELGHVFDDEDSHHHHHLICVKCGRVRSFQGDLLDEFEQKIEGETGFQIQDHDVKLYGYCADCLREVNVK
jgi:Fur family ferric uptake transcriptional regulator